MIFISYFLTNALESILMFIGTLNLGVISVLSHSFGLAMSLLLDKFDIVIMVFKLSWIVNFIGAFLLILKFKKNFAHF